MTTVPSTDRPTALVADVVICAYTDRRWEQLCRAVESVQVQTVAPGQILVFIDHNDELADRCDQRWPMTGQSAVPHVKVLRNRYPGRLGSARNTAIEHVSADMNGSPVFLFAALKMKLKMAARREVARNRGTPERAGGALDEDETHAFASMQRILFDALELPERGRAAGDAVSARRDSPADAVWIHGYFTELGARALGA